MTMHQMRPADRRCAPPRRTGAVLLEVIVALAILSTAGISLVALGSESAAAVRRAREADSAMRRASDFMDVVALWPREDLDRHLGERTEGAWRMRVDRPLPALYTVTLADSGTHRVLLRTALYRPEAANARR